MDHIEAERSCTNGEYLPSTDDDYETMDHTEAERKLKCCTNGEYLVRYSPQQEKFAIAVKWNEETVHCLIHTVPDPEHHGKYLYYTDVLEDDKFTLRLSTVHALIDYMIEKQIPVAVGSDVTISKLASIDKRTIRRDDIQRGETISQNGLFGEIYKATLVSQQKEVAIKTCQSSVADPDKRQFLKGIEILKRCDHPNIVRLIGVADEQYPILVVTEIMSGGTFFKFLRAKGASFAKKQLTEMCLQVCNGMAYLEEKNIVHCILGVRNCLVSKESGVVVVKIANIGMSREKNVTYKTSETPIRWTAPEALKSGIYTSASDVWSFGILLWETFSYGATPYSYVESVKNSNDALKWVEAGNRMPPPDGCPEPVYDVMHKCWDINEEQRPTFAKLCKMLNELCQSQKYQDIV